MPSRNCVAFASTSFPWASESVFLDFAAATPTTALALYRLAVTSKWRARIPWKPAPESPSEFMSHPRWQRLLIAVAGPAMNVLLAVGFVTGVFMLHYTHDWYLDQPTRVGWVDENSPAAKAGIKPGDLITQIDGFTNPLWEDTKAKIAISPAQPVPLVLKRNGQTLSLTITPDTYGPSRIGEAGLEPAAGVTVDVIETDMPGVQGWRPRR